MRILIATDGTPASRQAADRVLERLPRKNAEVFVLTVRPLGADLGDALVPAAALKDLVWTNKPSRPAWRAVACEGWSAASLDSDGDPATEVLSVAHALNPQVLVLGSGGRASILLW